MVVPRVKKFHSKVRSGCITCKKRRVKCDEEKPFCRRCITSVRQCEGYFVPENKAFQAEADSYDAVSKRLGPDVPVLQVAFNDATARRSFEFFVENAIPTFCAYFGRGFWARTFPQASFEHPILKHALVATAALIEKLEYDTDRSLADEVYKQHYNKALLLASSPSFASQVHTILMACLMFACCAFLQCSVHTGYQHILSGMKIIAEQYGTDPSSPESKRGVGDEFVLSSIAPLFASYAMKAPTYGYPLAWPENFPDISGRVDLACVSASFRSINHARHCLDGIAHCLFREQHFAEEDMHEHVSSEEILRMLKKWDHTVEMYLDSLRPLEVAKIRDSSLLLRAHRIVIEIMVQLRSSSLRTQNQMEDFIPRFQRINEYLRSILRNARDNHGYSDLATYFTSTGQLSSHLGFIPPLYFTAMTCHHLRTRLEALEIMKALHVVERAWTSCMAGAIVENVLLLEHGAGVLHQSTEEKDSKRKRSVTVNQVTNSSGKPTSASKTAIFEYEMTPLADSEHLAGENQSTLPSVTVKSSLDLPMCGCVKLTLLPLEKILRSSGYQGSIVPQPTNCLAGG